MIKKEDIMARRYNSSWDAKSIKINFNEKQWRQDFAEFARKKLFMSRARVTRSKLDPDSVGNEGIKYFEIYDGYGGSVTVKYQNGRDIVNSSHEELVKKYFEERKL